MHRVVKLPLKQLNPHITCPLCTGYYIDATTIVECLHSFCRSCLLSHLARHTACPVCDIQLHKTEPRKAIRPDRGLQSLVYKLVPGLFKAEMALRRDFYRAHPSWDAGLSPEGRGNAANPGHIVDEDETVSVSLELVDPSRLRQQQQQQQQQPGNAGSRSLRTDAVDLHRPCYLLAPACLTVGHLCTFLRLKLDLLPPPHQSVAIFYTEDCLRADYSIMDIAYVYSWRRRGPLRLFYAVLDHGGSTAAAAILQCQPIALPPTADGGGGGGGSSATDDTDMEELSLSSSATAAADS